MKTRAIVSFCIGCTFLLIYMSFIQLVASVGDCFLVSIPCLLEFVALYIWVKKGIWAFLHIAIAWLFVFVFVRPV